MSTTLRAGEVAFERFVIERRAGSGATGAVYCARDRSSGARVALKIITVDDGVDGERFEREARVLASLTHPGIVRYVGHGVSTDARYLAMEWLDGEDLASRLERKGLTIPESVTLVRRVAEALASAHERGVIHRDIKPRNLFLVGGDIERVKILDFGIARV